MRFYYSCATLCLVWLLAFVPVSHADNISREMRTGSVEPDSENGGYFEIGLGAGYSSSRSPDGYDDDEGFGAAGSIDWRYQYKRFFIEGVTLGYNAWRQEEWSVDIIGMRVDGGRGEDDDGLYAKVSPVASSGVRATHYLNNKYIVQYEVLGDVITGDRDGFQVGAKAGRHWQHRNWNFHALAGVDYLSQKWADHNYGVKAESGRNYIAYETGDAWVPTLEFAATYPLSTHWVFRAQADFIYIPDSLSRSPVVDTEYTSHLYFLVSYVF